MHTERRHRARKPYRKRLPTAGDVAKGASTAGDVLEVIESVAAFIPGVGGAIALGAKGGRKVAEGVEANAKKLERIAKRKKAAARKKASILAKRAAKKRGAKVDKKAVVEAIAAKVAEGSSTDDAAAAVAVDLDVSDDDDASSGGSMLDKIPTAGKVVGGLVVVGILGKLAKVW